MALTNLWSTTVAQGSSADWQFTFQNPDGTPYPIDSWTWEYVARAPRAATNATPAITLTTDPSTAGQITVTTSPGSVVTITLHPAATAGLTPGNYEHALWANPGTTDAFLWWEGSLNVQAVPQP